MNRAKAAAMTAGAILLAGAGGLVAVYHGIKGLELDDHWIGRHDEPPADLRAAAAEVAAAACYRVADRIESWAWWCETTAERLRGIEPGD